MRHTATVSSRGLVVDTTGIDDWGKATRVALSISDAGSDAAWAIGDICNGITSRVKATPQQRNRRIRDFAKSINQSYSFVRFTARTARYVPEQIRRSYPSLSYGHFREIVNKGHTELDVITEWADRATQGEWGIGLIKDYLYGRTPGGRLLIRKVLKWLPAIHEESIDQFSEPELLLLRENCLRIYQLSFLGNVAAERHVTQPGVEVVRPAVRVSVGRSLGSGPPVTPQAP